MTGPDPVDIRLLTAVAEAGRAALHEIAGRLGMDVREVAARLAVLSTTGLPLVVGVECDPHGIRNAVAAANAWNSQYGGYQAQASSSGGHQVQNPHSGGHPVHGAPSGPQPTQTGPSGPQPFVPPQPQSFGHGQQAPAGYVPPQGPPQPLGHQDPMNTWGPPGSAAWARGDQHRRGDIPQPAAPPVPATGKVGSKLDVEGLDGERITIQLVEVVDPADFLFTAAGYQLQEGERAVVVHTELTNRGSVPFTSLPDLYLVLVATDGSTISKAPVSLSSRPPHRIGVPPGETAGGHTVYVLPEETELSSVRWTPRPGDDHRTLTWDITDL